MDAPDSRIETILPRLRRLAHALVCEPAKAGDGRTRCWRWSNGRTPNWAATSARTSGLDIQLRPHVAPSMDRPSRGMAAGIAAGADDAARQGDPGDGGLAEQPARGRSPSTVPIDELPYRDAADIWHQVINSRRCLRRLVTMDARPSQHCWWEIPRREDRREADPRLARRQASTMPAPGRSSRRSRRMQRCWPRRGPFSDHDAGSRPPCAPLLDAPFPNGPVHAGPAIAQALETRMRRRPAGDQSANEVEDRDQTGAVAPVADHGARPAGASAAGACSRPRC